MDNYATDWMILKTTTDQDADSPELHRYYGSKEDVRQLLVNMVKWYREAIQTGIAGERKTLKKWTYMDCTNCSPLQNMMTLIK